MLAGLVKSPSRLAPTRNPDGAEHRAQIVLAAMADIEFITDDTAKVALMHPAHAVKPPGAGSVNYVADWVMDVLDDLVGRVEQDIVVETSIDPALQAAAEKALVDELAQERRQGRRRPGRGGGDDAGRRGARAGRRQELRRKPVQPRGRGQAPARLGVQAVRLSHRARARADARHRARGQADRRQRLAAGELRPRVFRPGDADPGAGAVAQHRVGAADPGVRPDGGDAHRASARHRLEARAQRVDRARHLGSLACSSWSAPMRRSPMAAWRSSPHVVERVRTAGGKMLYAAHRQQLGRIIERALRRHDERDDAARRCSSAPRTRPSCPAGRPPARPAPPRISATPGSSATPGISSPASGSATTTPRRPRRPPAAACRSRSGAAS